MAVPALPGSFETGALGRLILKVANLAVLVCVRALWSKDFTRTCLVFHAADRSFGV